MNYLEDSIIVLCYKMVCSLTIALAIIGNYECGLAQILAVSVAAFVAVGVIRIVMLKLGKAKAINNLLIDKLMANLPSFMYAYCIDVLISYLHDAAFTEELSLFAIIALGEIGAIFADYKRKKVK